MILKEYMDRDFELFRKRIIDVSSAYNNQDPGVTMEIVRSRNFFKYIRDGSP